MSVDLDKLAKQVDEALAKETKESLTKWLNKRRQKDERTVMKVVSKGIQCYHYYGQCNDCDFNECASHNGDINRVRNAVRRHVLKTGHTVKIEKGYSIIYNRE